ncbi:MAG: hypothetical protein QXN68_03465 [Thermoplasmata archaeon]
MLKNLRDRNQRDIIIVIDDEFDRELRYNRDIRFSVPENKGVAILNIGKLDEISNELPEFIQIIKHLAKPGDILLRVPFEEYEYVKIEDAEYEIPQRKIECVMTFCGLLGAKKATFIELVNTTKNTTLSFQTDGSYRLFKGSINYEDEFLLKFSSNLKYQREWKGNPKLDKAKQYMYEKGLIRESACKSLFEEVTYNPENLKIYRKEIQLTSELKTQLKIVAECKIPKIFNISVDINSKYNEISDYKLVFEVCF